MMLKNLFKTQANFLKLQVQKPLFGFSNLQNVKFKVKVEKDPVNVKDVQYPYYQDEGVAPPQPKMFIAHMKDKDISAKKKKEFILYQQRLKEQAEQNLQNQKTKQQEKVEKEFLWDSGIPEERPYDKVTNKELTYIYRDEKYFERSNKMISHLQFFQTPQTIHDQQIRQIIDSIKSKATQSVINNSDVDFSIEDFYSKDEEITSQFKQLRDLVSQVNYKLLPSIGLALSFELRYKVDYAKVWEAYIDVLNKNLHHYTPIEMAQIKHALHGNYPKIGSAVLHKALLDIVSSELYMCSISELMHLLHAFRNVRKDRIQSKIIKEITKRRSEMKEPEEVVNFIYEYATCRVKTANRNKFRQENEELIEAQELVELFIEPLKKTLVNKVSGEGAIKLGTAISILRLPNLYQDLLLRIEANIVKNKAQLDSTMVAQSFYMLSKILKGLPYGSKEFYKEMYPLVVKNFASFTKTEIAKIMFAYSSRKQLTEEQLNKQFLPWIKKEMPNFSYSDLHYIAYTLMYQNVVDKHIWKAFMHNIANQTYNCPTSHYLPIKFARYYMDKLFPEWNFEPLEQACRQAEFSYNTHRLKRTFFTPDLSSLTEVLVQKLQIDPQLMLEFDNLMLVDIAIVPERVGILYQNANSSQYDDQSVSSPYYDLRAKILENNNWGVLKLNKVEYENQGTNKFEWLKNKFEEVYKKQSEAYKNEDLDRWGHTVAKIEAMGANATLPSEAHKDQGQSFDF